MTLSPCVLVVVAHAEPARSLDELEHDLTGCPFTQKAEGRGARPRWGVGSAFAAEAIVPAICRLGLLLLPARPIAWVQPHRDEHAGGVAPRVPRVRAGHLREAPAAVGRSACGERTPLAGERPCACRVASRA